MKRLLALITAIGMVFCTAALASEGVLVEDAPYSDFYDYAATAEGNVILALGLRYELNTTEGEHAQRARLACLDPDGKLLWEVIGEEGDNAYVGVSVLSDGTVLALYVDRTDRVEPGYARTYLHSFSPTGERIGEAVLPEDYSHTLETDAGMLVTLTDRSQSGTSRRVALYDGTLEPVWTLENLSFSTRYDCSVVDDAGMTLLHRKTNWTAEAPIDQVRLTRISADGRELWTKVLAEEQMGYMKLQADPDGNFVVYMNSWLDNGRGQSADGTLRCFDPDGNGLWERPLRFPEEDGKYEVEDFRLLPDGYLFMGMAKTRTRVRLYRYDAEGALVGYTDHFLHEEANYSHPEMTGPVDRLRAWVTYNVDRRSSVWMMPLEIPQ